MSIWFLIVTILFMLVALAMVLIILVQRPQGGGLAGAFGGAGGSSTDTVFGGRVGDALTVATVVAFVLYLSLAIALNILDNPPKGGPAPAAATGSAGPAARRATARPRCGSPAHRRGRRRSTSATGRRSRNCNRREPTQPR